MTLAALAQATRRLRLGTLVTGIHYRHPAVLANMAATLDVMSGGRLELGIGAGWNEEESGAYGIELGTPRERSDRFEEACAGADRPAVAADDHVHGQLLPAHRRAVRAQAGCSGRIRRSASAAAASQRTLRTAARYAQHWNFVGGTPEEFAPRRDVLHAALRRHRPRSGRDPAVQPCAVHRGPGRDGGQRGRAG